MLFFVLGVPGPFSRWCSTAVAALARRSRGPTSVIEANTLGEVSRALLRGDAPHVMIRAPAPGARLRRALLAADRPFVLAEDDPRLACADLVLCGQSEFSEAVRQIASSCGATATLRSAMSRLVLRADLDWNDCPGTASAIAEHLRFGLGARDFAEVLREIESVGLDEGRDAAAAWWDALGAAEREMMEGALAPYLGTYEIAAAASIVWGGDLFFIGDRFDQRANRPIDITGRARCLLHGPYIMLPPGTWSAVLSLQFSHEAAEHDFLVEVITDRQLASATIRPHTDG